MGGSLSYCTLSTAADLAADGGHDSPDMLTACLGAGQPITAMPRGGSTAFGTAVGISDDGKTVLIGDPQLNTGAGGVFAIPMANLTAQTTLMRPTGSSTQFGAAISVSSKGVLVGAGQSGTDVSAFLYRTLGAGPTVITSTVSGTSAFGQLVAISTSRVAVAGAVGATQYVLSYPSSGTNPIKTDLAANQTVQALTLNDDFTAISIQNSGGLNKVTIVPADGSASIDITPPPVDPPDMMSAISTFGAALSLSSPSMGTATQLAIGFTASSGLDHPAYVFAGPAWQRIDNFFAKQSLDGGDTSTAMVFAHDYLAIGIPNREEVWIYKLGDTPLTRLLVLKRPDSLSNHFGRTLSANGNTLVIGAPSDLSNNAAAYLFQ